MLSKLPILCSFASSVMLCALFGGCVGCNEWVKTKPVLPETPHNMTDANSIYDDMNSVPPAITGYSYFYFSSNRNSKGKEFDIVSADFGFLFDRKSKNYRSATSVDESPVNDSGIGRSNIRRHFFQASKLLPLVNTKGYNELGPYGYIKQSADRKYFKHYLLYSNDESENLNVKFAYAEGEYEHPDGSPSVPPSILSLKGNMPANLLNSDSNDAYPSIDDVNGIIYFCSDRGGKFQIYQVKYDPSKDLADELQSTKNKPEIVPSLASQANDKCPFVRGDVMAFVSDREGGLGGFDLYYSLREANGVWGAPVNFGSAINTSSDEYRPIMDQLDVGNFDKFTNDLLIFSSNRPGGLGGYDLYFVGIPKHKEN